MTNTQIKQQVIEAILGRDCYVKKVNDVEYRTRCPFCGDSQSNYNTGHLYIRINPDDDFPIVYNCFKCNESGILNNETLSALGIDDINLKSSIKTLNETSSKIKSHMFLQGPSIIMFDYKRPPIERGPKTEYIEKRMGKKLTDEELYKFKVVTSLRQFLKLNQITADMIPTNFIKPYNFLPQLEEFYVGFLSFGNSYILFRDLRKDSKLPWVKFPVTKESQKSKGLYSIEQSIDTLSTYKLEINLCEGVMDAISAYTNLGYTDALNIAVLGKNYQSTISFLVDLGLVGSNVSINVFADNDVSFNKKCKNPTDIEYFTELFRKVKYLYKDINIYYNIIYKDIGVSKDIISLVKKKIV